MKVVFSRRCVILASFVATLVLPLVSHAQNDDFNDGNDAGWTRYNPLAPLMISSYSFPNGGYRLLTAPSPAPGTTGPARVGSIRDDVSYTDFFVSVDIVNWDDNRDQVFGLLARVDNVGPGTTVGYAFTYRRGTTSTSGDVDVSRITGEVPTGVTLTGEDSYHFVAGRTYRMVFIGQGAQLTGKVFELPNLETPVVTVTGTDTQYPDGALGLVIFDPSTAANVGADATFDNYSASVAEPPRMSSELNSFGEIIVRWPTNAGPFRLEATTNLIPPISWSEIPSGDITVIGPNFEYLEDATVGRKFFRLIQD